MNAKPNPWPLRGYAPGSYLCRCISCGCEFEGDKRATECLECAITASLSRAKAIGDGVGVKALQMIVTSRAAVTDEELGRWAKVRADDAGHLARELIAYRHATTARDAAALADAPEPVAPPRSYGEITEPYRAALHMVREAIETIFGPRANLESEEAELLRGPEPHHTAEAIIAALQNIAAADAETAAHPNDGPNLESISAQASDVPA
ncbi:hypothetical protein [Ensifer aridi]|uniref:hypothetical protein n=1 Tax=Ensifer aridi TaxID=1708715 RepID=UPI000A113926|nr:hypothetical protein [Ensifer aridi]